MPRVNQQTKTDTRRALLDAAAGMFAERGYHATRIDDVSERAGFAKGTVYNYFDSKEQVFHSLLRGACALAAEAADNTPAGASTRVRLEAFVAANMRWAQRHKALAVVFARELLGGDAQTRRLIVEAAAPCIQKVASILEEGIERGEVGARAPAETLALTFISLANMLLLGSLEPGASWPPADSLPTMSVQLFLDGVGG